MGPQVKAMPYPKSAALASRGNVSAIEAKEVVQLREEARKRKRPLQLHPALQKHVKKKVLVSGKTP